MGRSGLMHKSELQVQEELPVFRSLERRSTRSRMKKVNSEESSVMTHHSLKKKDTPSNWFLLSSLFVWKMEEWDFLARSECGLPVSHCSVRRPIPAQVSTNWLTILLCVMNKQTFLCKIELIWIYLPRYRHYSCFNLGSLHCQSGWVGLAFDFCSCRQNSDWLLQAFWPWEGQIQLNIIRRKEAKWSLTKVQGVVAIAKVMEASSL